MSETPENLEPAPMEELPASYTVTNISSRSFIFGEQMLLPKVPVIVNEDMRQTILNSKYAEFFEFVEAEQLLSSPSQPVVNPLR